MHMWHDQNTQSLDNEFQMIDCERLFAEFAMGNIIKVPRNWNTDPVELS